MGRAGRLGFVILVGCYRLGRLGLADDWYDGSDRNHVTARVPSDAQAVHELVSGGVKNALEQSGLELAAERKLAAEVMARAPFHCRHVSLPHESRCCLPPSPTPSNASAYVSPPAPRPPMRCRFLPTRPERPLPDPRHSRGVLISADAFALQAEELAERMEVEEPFKQQPACSATSTSRRNKLRLQRRCACRLVTRGAWWPWPGRIAAHVSSMARSCNSRKQSHGPILAGVWWRRMSMRGQRQRQTRLSQTCAWGGRPRGRLRGRQRKRVWRAGRDGGGCHDGGRDSHDG